MKPYWLIMLVSLFFLFVSPVYADVDLTQIPNQLAQRLNISVFAAQLLVSTLFLFGILLPLAYLARKRNVGPLLVLIVALPLISFLIAIQWLPYWILLVFILTLAALFGARLRDWIVGRGGGE